MSCPRSPTHTRRWWFLLLLFSAVLGAALIALHIPAGILLGCMLAGIVLSSRDVRLDVPMPLSVLAQGVLGCLMARSLQPSILPKLASNWPIFLIVTVSVIAASAGLGWVLMRRRVLPGPTAVWGLAPGGASAMVVMAGEFGADVQLVAFMQYLRVALVTALASLVARLWSTHSHAVHASLEIPWFSVVSFGDFGCTLTLAFAGASIARWLRITAGPMLAPMVLGTALQGLGVLTIELPPALLAVAYAVIGWSIGLRFTRSILRHAYRALPQVLAAIVALIGVGVAIALGLTRLAGFDPLTAYLATSPGGADSVAVIAATSAVDAGFVMAMQVARLTMVLAFGPRLSRFVAGRMGAGSVRRGGPG
jgi:membrane AbrB-like protein